jgi:elongator complex protein 1
LNELQQLEHYYQRFTIDDLLKKYPKALANLALSGEQYFDDCIRYIKKHDLYREALNVFSKQESKYTKVLVIYADYLVDRGEVEEAGILYTLASQKLDAIDCYKKAGLWQQAFKLAHDLNYTPDLLSALAIDLRDELYEQKKYKEAAYVMRMYANDSKAAIDLLVKSNNWSEAVLIVLFFLYHNE